MKAIANFSMNAIVNMGKYEKFDYTEKYLSGVLNTYIHGYLMSHGHACEEDHLPCCGTVHDQQQTPRAHFGPWQYQTFLHELTRQHLLGCESFSSFLMFPTHPTKNYVVKTIESPYGADVPFQTLPAAC